MRESRQIWRSRYNMVSCIICGVQTASVAVKLGNAALAACPACDSWTYLPRPDQHAQSAIHDSDEYFAHQYFELRRAITPELRRRCRATFARIGKWADLDSLRGQRVLDVGCDTGAFVRCAAEEFGIMPVGVDVASRAVVAAREAGVEAYEGTIEHAPQTLRDLPVITAIDVVEHVAEPREFLVALCERLRPGGVVYLETPNIQSLVYRLGAVMCSLLRGRPAGVWNRLFPPQHLQYFTRDSLADVCRRAGFDVREITTRPLPVSDIAANVGVRLGVEVLQAWDRVRRQGILLCAVVMRPIR